MSKKIVCDKCERIVGHRPFIHCLVKEISPHNGTISWEERDICFECLKTANQVRVSWEIYNA